MTGGLFRRRRLERRIAELEQLLDEGVTHVEQLRTELDTIAEACWASGGEFWLGSYDPKRHFPILSDMIDRYETEGGG